jgi:hypothetical protein
LFAVASFGYVFRSETIGLLIRRGADVFVRDRAGSTCLHYALADFHTVEFKIEQHRISLVLLVDAGADIHAVDSMQESVSEVAIRCGTWGLWQEVLRMCGKDLEKIYVALREEGWSLPGDPNYLGGKQCYIYDPHGRQYGPGGELIFEHEPDMDVDSEDYDS